MLLSLVLDLGCQVLFLHGRDVRSDEKLFCMHHAMHQAHGSVRSTYVAAHHTLAFAHLLQYKRDSNGQKLLINVI
jgi:hypothetical protein